MESLLNGLTVRAGGFPAHTTFLEYLRSGGLTDPKEGCAEGGGSQRAFRGFGGPRGMLVMEDILDRLARTLYRQGWEAHSGQPVKDAGRGARIWEEVRRSSDFAARRRAIVKFGISFPAAFFNQAGALVLYSEAAFKAGRGRKTSGLILRKNGAAIGGVQVSHGGTEMGQGLYTRLRQVAATLAGPAALPAGAAHL